MNQPDAPNSKDEIRKSARTLAALFLAMAVLVSTHLGEFWPFSIYPMFSRAGKPWSRAIVVDVSRVPDSVIWSMSDIEQLPGEPFALRDHGIEGPDVANFVVKNRNWSVEGQKGFRKIFLDYLSDRSLMLYRLDGKTDGDSIVVRATPVMLMTSDTTLVNPNLGLDRR